MRRESVAIRAMSILAFIGSLWMVSSTIPVFSQGIRKPEPPAAAISLTAPPDQTQFTVCSLYAYALPAFSWNAGEIFENHEIQFSLDQSFSSAPPIKVKTPSATIPISASIWRKILSLSGPSGGTIYWRVVGTAVDQAKSATFSEVRSMMIDPAQMGSPNLSPTIKSSIPALSWQNNCNVKFKVWFGNDENFTGRRILSFSVRNPMESGGIFSWKLSSHQWSFIRKLVGDKAGERIYWKVESWDGLGRYSKTGMMSFDLAE